MAYLQRAPPNGTVDTSKAKIRAAYLYQDPAAHPHRLNQEANSRIARVGKKDGLRLSVEDERSFLRLKAQGDLEVDGTGQS